MGSDFHTGCPILSSSFLSSLSVYIPLLFWLLDEAAGGIVPSHIVAKILSILSCAAIMSNW